MDKTCATCLLIRRERNINIDMSGDSGEKPRYACMLGREDKMYSPKKVQPGDTCDYWTEKT